MGTQRIETVIIGAGQAGLATAYHLKQRGRKCLVLEGLPRVGDNWRRHYDSLRLYSPAKISSLPGLAFPGQAMHLPTKDEVGDYLEAYREQHDLPVRTGIRVTRVWRDGEDLVVETPEDTFRADNVVVATGTFGRPHTPAFAADLDPGIRQLHSSQYRNPGQLQAGPVLVVGAAHSGADVALDVAPSHRTYLSGRFTGEVPFDLEGPLVRRFAPVFRFVTQKVISTRTPIGRKVQPKVRAHGAPLLRVRRDDLVDAGIEWIEERTEGVVDGKPQLASGRVLDVANVVWCTGYRQDFSWLDLPVVVDDGWPKEDRGVVPDVPGLYFMGLAFQQAFASMLILGAGQDAQHVVTHIDRRMRARDRQPAMA